MDGSTPTQAHGTPVPNNTQIQVPVPNGQTKTLKAIGFKPGMTPSSVKSADYTFDRECSGVAEGYPLDNAGLPPAGPVAPDLTGTVTYSLDEAGNRTAVNGIAYSPNTINQYTSVGGAVLTNGDDHEIQQYGGFTYHYMRDQELKQITATGFTYDFAYDALGRCVKRTVNDAMTTYYFYDGDKPILEYDGTNNALVGFNVYGKGVDEIIQRGAYGTDNLWHWYFLQQDHEGSVTHLTDFNGAIIERYRYDAFGTPSIYAPNWTVRTGSSYSNRFLFTGREYLGAWVYDYRARVYHSYLGRFMSEDPKLFDAGDYNLFRYCHNDPIDMTDPMGLAGEIPGGLLQSGTHDRVWDMTRWFDRSNLVQGNFQGFAYLSLQSDRDAKGLSSQTYSLKSQYKIGDLSGARGYQYVWDSNDKCSGQCLTGVQHLTGTPDSNTPLVRGAAVGADTLRGIAIAKGWVLRNGQYVYPSKPAGQSDNHAAVFVAPIGKGRAQILSQYNISPSNRAPLHLEVVPTSGWHVITSPLPARTASGSELRAWDGSIPW
jgi:RHS repeat-associated protein